MEPDVTAEPLTLRPQVLALLGLLALLLLGGKLLLVDRLSTPLRRSVSPPVAQETNLSAGGLSLAGYTLSQQRVPSGGQFDIDLAWKVQATPGQALQSNVWLRDEQGLIWSERETYRPRIYEDAPSTQQWQPGQWAWDSREVHVLSGTPPGRYELVLTLFDLANLQPLTLVRDGTAIGPTAVIGEIEVVRPQDQPQFQPQFEFGQPPQIDGLQLLGYNQDREMARPGDPVLVTLFWEILSPDVSPAQELVLSLRDAGGSTHREWQIAPLLDSFPAERWQAGDRLRGQHLLRLPPSLDSDEYRFWLQDVALGTLRVDAPQRLFEEPAYEQSVKAVFGEQVRLAGYSLSPVSELDSLPEVSPSSLSVTIVWQALSEMDVSYRVFVHLVDEDGQIIAQSDAEPAQWMRPTTGWVTGEFVLDQHHLALPARYPEGPLALRVGLFDPDSGERLRLENEADYVTIQP